MTETSEGAASQLGARAVSNSVFILVARTVAKVISLVVVIVLANGLGDADYGRFATLVTYSAIVSVAADLGFAPLYTREAARNRGRLGDYLGTLLVFRVALAIAAALIFSVALGVGTGLWSLVIPGSALLVATAYASQLRDTFYAVGRAEFDAVALLGEIAILAGLVLVGSRLHAGVGFYVWAYTASSLFTIVYSLAVIQVFHLGRIRFRLDLDLIRRWWPLALPFAYTSFLTNVYFDADRPILQHFRSFAEVGWYQFAYKPFEATQFVPLAIQAVVYPLLGVYFVSDIARLRVAYHRFFKVLVLLGWPLTVGTFVLVHQIGRLFRLYPQSEPSLRILAFAIVFLFANSAFLAMLNATNRQHLNAWATGLAALINVALNLIFIPLYGYLAASATTVITEAALCTLGWWFVQRRRPELRLPVPALAWRILLAGAIMGVVLFPLRALPIYLTVPVGFAVYVVAAFLLRAVERDEYELAAQSLLSRLRRNAPRTAVVGEDGKA